MPGSALWLVPPPDIEAIWSQLTAVTIPAAFSKCRQFPILTPHITLTSGIPDSITDSPPETRQKWLDSLPLFLNAPPIIAIQSLIVGERITQKVILLVEKEGPIVDLAVQLRAMAVEGGSIQVAQNWAQTNWIPHISLLYADTKLDELDRAQAEKLVKESGVLSDERRLDGAPKKGTPWMRAKVLWVDTRKDIQDWIAIGERPLPH